MDNRGPKVTGKVKVGPHGRTFDVKTRPISEIFIKTDWSKDGMGLFFCKQMIMWEK